MSFRDPPTWSGASSDPNDEQLGDTIRPLDLETVGDVSAALVGEPYDGAVIGRPGAREGPAAIRDALAGVYTEHFRHGRLPTIGDLGDVVLPTGASVDTVQARLAEITAEVHKRETTPIFLGGDNSVTVPNVAPITERGRTGVVSIDAHLDCREVRDQPTSGTPYRQLLTDGLDDLVVFGARDFATSPSYVSFARDHGATIVPAREVATDRNAAIETVLEAIDPVETLYVSLDLDVIAAPYAPAVSAPSPAGITPQAVFTCLAHLCADSRLAGVEVVECAPPLASNDRTATLAATAIAHALSEVSASG